MNCKAAYAVANFKGTWLYTDADNVLYDEEYIARVTCVETGASEEYSEEMVVNVYIERDDTCNESFADSTTATTASTNIVSISSTPSQNAFQQNQVNCDDTLGLWPVYVALSFLIGVATGALFTVLLQNKCKGKQQTR